jgi:predicted metal-dependent enzyme (double-stranded beta helix superfamily)
MQHTLESFAAACREVLRQDDTPAGRVKVAALLKEVLRDEAFIAARFAGDCPERKIVYEDPQLGFCILAHEYRGPKESAPHDHGPSWAIYGQVSGETMMSDWAVIEPASADKPGKVRKTRDYKLVPGDAHVYNEGDVHSPSRTGPTRLIRIEGTNMERVARSRFEPVA